MLLAEAGVEYTFLCSSTNIPVEPSIRSLGSIRLTCPSAGYVILMAKADGVASGDNTTFWIGSSTSTIGKPGLDARPPRYHRTSIIRCVCRISPDRSRAK